MKQTFSNATSASQVDTEGYNTDAFAGSSNEETLLKVRVKPAAAKPEIEDGLEQPEEEEEEEEDEEPEEEAHREDKV